MKDEIRSAIRAHAEWKGKFQEFMAGEMDLDMGKVRLPNQCEFGKWIETEGKRHLDPKTFADLSALHAKFHQAAAEVVKKKKSGDTRGATASLGANGEFANVSADLVSKLMELDRAPVPSV